MSKVTPLHEGIKINAGEVNEGLVRSLRDMLEMAERGHLQSYIGTGFTSDMLRVSTWSDDHDDVYQMLGSIEWLKVEYIRRHSE